MTLVCYQGLGLCVLTEKTRRKTQRRRKRLREKKLGKGEKAKREERKEKLRAGAREENVRSAGTTRKSRTRPCERFSASQAARQRCLPHPRSNELNLKPLW